MSQHRRQLCHSRRFSSMSRSQECDHPCTSASSCWRCTLRGLRSSQNNHCSIHHPACKRSHTMPFPSTWFRKMSFGFAMWRGQHQRSTCNQTSVPITETVLTGERVVAGGWGARHTLSATAHRAQSVTKRLPLCNDQGPGGTMTQDSHGPEVIIGPLPFLKLLQTLFLRHFPTPPRPLREQPLAPKVNQK